MSASPSRPGLPFSLFPSGEPKPLTFFHQGLQYRGEAIHSSRWDPAWGRTLEEDVYFRIVFLRNSRQVPSSDIQDSRIAVCIPGRRPSRGQGPADRELMAIRETQALYLTQRDPETSFIRGHLARQREALESQLASEEAARYGRGHIESPTVFQPGDIGEFFIGPDPADWYQRIASALLSWAYPALPLSPALLPRPMASEDIPRIYQAIFASSAEDRAPLGDFGPGLGLSKPTTPLLFDPGECQVFGQILVELERRQGELPWGDIHLLLAHASGLTRPLATLYLLAFAFYSGREGQPETELGLAPGHGLTFLDGRPVRGVRLTREFIPFLPWREDLYAEKILSLRLLRREASWNDALQYTSLLCQGLTEAEESSSDLSRQEGELRDVLRELATDADQARDVLETLSRTISSPNEGEPLSALQRLLEVCEGGDFRRVYELCRNLYGSQEELLHDLGLLIQLLHLGDSLQDIIDTKAYLDGAVVQGRYRQLDFDRTTLLEEMSLPVLLASPQGWPTVRAHIREFQARYRRAYANHHSYYQRQVSQVRASLEDSHLKLRALALLNSIPELGEPVGLDLEQRYDTLEQMARLCDVDPWGIPLHPSAGAGRGLTARCPNCQMALGKTPPVQELELFQRGLDHALGEQNRRLSLVLVERLLHGQIDQRLENFLKIVQASDLSALSNTLNADLAVFVRQFLRNPFPP